MGEVEHGEVGILAPAAGWCAGGATPRPDDAHFAEGARISR
jgi:hypothetical protein